MTNYFQKYKSLFSTTVTTSVDASGTSGTITLASVVGLPTDTEITLTFERVATDGVTLTPTKMERIRGTISGSNLINYTRAVEGTEQAHSSGSIVEVIFNGSDWNSAVDGILVEHNQTGTHKSALVTTLKASGSDVTTGTSDLKIVTPKALADAGIIAPPVTLTNTVALSNKEIVQRVVTTTDDATAVIDVSVTDDYELSAIANATTISTTGTPKDGQKFVLRLKDAGVAKGLTWDAIFVAIGCTLPTTTVAGKWHYIGGKYNSSASKIHILAVAQEA